MKRFSERSQKGKRNLIILYFIIFLFLLAIIFILLNNVGFSKNLTSLIQVEDEINDSFTNPPEDQFIPTVDKYVSVNKEELYKIEESEFINDAINYLGYFYSTVTNNDISDGIGNGELIKYVYSTVIPNYKFNSSEFEEVLIDDLSVGDLGYTNGVYGIYLGYINERRVFLTSSPIGACYEIDQGMVTLNYLSADSNELLYGMFPMAFESFYHNPNFDFSKGNKIDTTKINSIYTEETIYSKIENLTYTLSTYVNKGDYKNVLKYLNTSYLENNMYGINENQFIKYFKSLFGLETTLLSTHKQFYFKIDSYIKIDDSYICDIKICSMDDNYQLDWIRTTTFTIFTDMTFLPCSVLDIDFDAIKYGFVHINDKETVVQYDEVGGETNSYDNNFIQKEDGRVVIRQEGFDFDISQILEKH